MSGTVSVHSEDRAVPADVTGTSTPRACVTISWIGDPAGATAIRPQPRRAASRASASASTVCPELEGAITMSAAPTQPGSESPLIVSTCTGDDCPTMAARISPARTPTPAPATMTARGLESGPQPAEIAFLARPQRGAYLRGGRGDLP